MKISDADLINQLRNVLRFSIGDKILLGDGKINEALVEIKKIDKDFIAAEILELRLNKSEPQKQVALYCAILKRENFELICQKTVETGVYEITPIICERTVKFGLKSGRLEKIIKEAAEQSGRGFLSILKQTISLEKAMEQAKENDINLFFDSSGADFVREATKDKKKIGVFIGPEGGWDEEEIKLAQENNFKIVSLGKLTLRAETAAIIASYIVTNF